MKFAAMTTNHDPCTEHLAAKRGKRPKLDHSTVAMRLSKQTKAALEALALRHGCTYGGKPRIAGLLTKLGNGELLLVQPSPTPAPAQPEEKLTFEQARALAARIRESWGDRLYADSTELIAEDRRR
jgi:hypothetical protein